MAVRCNVVVKIPLSLASIEPDGGLSVIVGKKQWTSMYTLSFGPDGGMNTVSHAMNGMMMVDDPVGHLHDCAVVHLEQHHGLNAGVTGNCNKLKMAMMGTTRSGSFSDRPRRSR